MLAHRQRALPVFVLLLSSKCHLKFIHLSLCCINCSQTNRSELHMCVLCLHNTGNRPTHSPQKWSGSLPSIHPLPHNTVQAWQPHDGFISSQTDKPTKNRHLYLLQASIQPTKTNKQTLINQSSCSPPALADLCSHLYHHCLTSRYYYCSHNPTAPAGRNLPALELVALSPSDHAAAVLLVV